MGTTTATVTTTTDTEWEDFAPCQHCGQLKRDHMEDGKCLFEASSYKPRDVPGLLEIATWSYKMVEPVKPNRPYPQQTKFAQRKEQRLQMKAQRKGRV